MSIDGIRRAFRVSLFTKRQIERDVDDEIAFHIARRAERLEREGMSAEEALAEAMRRFGNTESVRDDCVDVDHSELRRDRMLMFVDDLRGDVRFAWRSLGRAPGFVAVTLTTLIVGIAAITSIFSYMDAIYFGRLPYHDADRVVALSQQLAGSRFAPMFSGIAPEVVPFVRQATHSFERFTTYSEQNPSVTFGQDPVLLKVLQIDTAFIPFFDLRPELGRLLSPEEIAGDTPGVMISDQIWRTKYGSDSAIVGKPLRLGARDFEIVGVLPPGFRFPRVTDALIPLPSSADTGIVARTERISVLAKLRSGETRDQARTEMNVVANRLTSIDSKVYRGAQLLVRDEMLDRSVQNFLPRPSLFLGAGLFLLLIACSNVANLFYVRAAERREEMAIRAALGAGSSRLIRQALTEGLLISVVAAILGTWLSMLLIRLFLHSINTSGFPSWFHVTVDLRVLGFAIGVTALVTIAVALAPAREGVRFDLVRTLKGGGNAGASSRDVTRGGKRGLVLQLGLSVALFATAILLVRSYQRLVKLDFGYPADQIATITPYMDDAHYGDYRSPSRIAFAEQIAERAVLVPGVSGVALRGDFAALRTVPRLRTAPEQPSRSESRLVPDGDTTRAIAEPYTMRWYVVSDPYFELLHLHVRQGRNFGSADASGSLPVAVISARMAGLLWGTTSPIGRTIRGSQLSVPVTIIGVVDDVRDMLGGRAGFTNEPGITIYLSDRQATAANPRILLTSRGDLSVARRSVLDLVRAAEPTLVIGRETTLASQLDEAFVITRVLAAIIGAFAVSALFLSLIGIYGVVAFGIAQRTREIGIRMALGGTPAIVVRMIAGETFRFVSVGLVIGLVLAAAIGPLVKSFLYDISPLDPATYVIVSTLFAIVALAASYLPARRATRIDPLAALRSE